MPKRVCRHAVFSVSSSRDVEPGSGFLPDEWEPGAGLEYTSSGFLLRDLIQVIIIGIYSKKNLVSLTNKNPACLAHVFFLVISRNSRRHERQQ